MKAQALATPVLLIVLAAGVAAYAYLVDSRTVSDADRAARRKDVFPSFRVEDVTRIRLEHGDEVLVLERTAGGDRGAPTNWTMTSPRRGKADAATVDALLRELELATWSRRVDATAAVGLSAPRARGEVTVGALEVRFGVGADAPRPEGGAYLQVEGEGAFVVGRSLKVQLLRGADAYRDRTLVPVLSGEVERVDVQAAQGARRFTMERRGATFRIAGSGLRVPRGVVDRLFSALADARATTFLPDGPADGGHEGVTVTITSHGQSRPPTVVHVGGACPGQPDEIVVAVERGDRACAAKGLVDALTPSEGALVDTSPLFARSDEIEQIRLEGLASGGTSVDIARKGKSWRERSPEDRDLDPEESDSADRLARALADARALDARRAGEGERPVARARVTIVRAGGAVTEVVELGGPRVEGGELARRLDDGAILNLPRAVARRFEPHPVALRPRSIWRPSIDAGAVTGVESGCGSVPQRLELRGGAWKMRAPAGFAADALSIADLAGAITHAKAEAWIAEKDDGTFGLDGPGSCTVTISLRDPEGDAAVRRVSVVFGGDADGGVYARTLDDPAVFVAPEVLRDLSSRPAVDRSPLRFDTGTLAAVTLERGTEQVTLERAGGRLVRRGATDAGADDRLEVALAGLSAQSVTRVGPPARDEGLDRPALRISAKAELPDAAASETRAAFGACGRVAGADVCFARVAGVDATFAVPQRAVKAVLDAL